MSRGRLPHAIESTAQLTEAIINDYQGNSRLVIQLAYSTAICRFVNGLLDGSQKSHYAVSMFSLAQNLGLPSSFVDIRHAATHEALPSLVILRKACYRALDWLWVNYWEKIDLSGNVDMSLNSSQPSVKADGQISKLKVLLEEWQALKGSRTIKGRQSEMRKAGTRDRILQSFTSIFAQGDDMDELIDVMLSDYVLSEQEKGYVGSKILHYYQADFQRISNSTTIKKSVALWMPLLSHLMKEVKDFSSTLFEEMLETLLETDDRVDSTSEGSTTEISSAELAYHWMVNLLSLVIKDGADTSERKDFIVEEVISQCILSKSSRYIYPFLCSSVPRVLISLNRCIQVAEFAISRSKALKLKFSQACALAKQQIVITLEPPMLSNSTNDTASSLDIEDSEVDLDDFEARLQALQKQRKHWATTTNTTILKTAELGNSNSSHTYQNTTNSRWQKYEGEWTAKPMGGIS